MAVPKLIRFSSPWKSLLLALLNYAMVVALAITLAYWAWQLLQPAPLPAVPVIAAPNQNLSATINARHWFGEGNGGTDASSTSSFDMKLVGIFGSLNNASGKHPGFAIFQMSNGKQLHAMLNQDFSAGLKLTNISRDSVTVLQNGVAQNITLDEKSRPLEIARIKSNTAPSKAEGSAEKIRQIKIVGVKPKPVAETAPSKPVNAELAKATASEQSVPTTQPAHNTEAVIARQNADDMKYLPVEKSEPKLEEQHASTGAAESQTDVKIESEAEQLKEKHEEKKGLLDLLNNVKNWVTGKKPE
ncbi:MAG TPA: type II secretion system protein N [Methylophilaceae bacterium]|nr:type II secretion system protein N [Methylophilaceae bacterium]